MFFNEPLTTIAYAPVEFFLQKEKKVPWWKSGVTSHCKNWQISCHSWGWDELYFYTGSHW